MVRNYQRKGKRCNWTLEQLNAAIQDVVNKVSSVRAASKAYGVPRSTIQDALAAPPNKEPGKLDAVQFWVQSTKQSSKITQ